MVAAVKRWMMLIGCAVALVALVLAGSASAAASPRLTMREAKRATVELFGAHPVECERQSRTVIDCASVVPTDPDDFEGMDDTEAAVYVTVFKTRKGKVRTDCVWAGCDVFRPAPTRA